MKYLFLAMLFPISAFTAECDNRIPDATEREEITSCMNSFSKLVPDQPVRFSMDEKGQLYGLTQKEDRIEVYTKSGFQPVNGSRLTCSTSAEKKLSDLTNEYQDRIARVNNAKNLEKFLRKNDECVETAIKFRDLCAGEPLGNLVSSVASAIELNKMQKAMTKLMLDFIKRKRVKSKRASYGLDNIPCNPSYTICPPNPPAPTDPDAGL